MFKALSSACRDWATPAAVSYRLSKETAVLAEINDTHEPERTQYSS
jgi:hypothetical protein